MINIKYIGYMMKKMYVNIKKEDERSLKKMNFMKRL
jgi:hypothetical protein